MAKSPEELLNSMIRNLKEKTGKDLDEWHEVIGMSKLAKHGEIVKYLKSEHGMTHGFANTVTHLFLQKTSNEQMTENDLVDEQYSAKKEALRPVYDALIQLVTKFGGDVEIAPKKAYVSLRRNKQFAIIQPSTATRVDVGINLKDAAPTDRLEASKSFNAMVSHRVRLSSPDDVDAELMGWLKSAYEAS